MGETAQEQVAEFVTGEMLADAIGRGFTVAPETEKALAEKQAETPAAEPEPEPEVDPDSPAARIIQAIEAEVGDKLVSVEEEMEQEQEPDTDMPDFEAEAEREMLDAEVSGDFDYDEELTPDLADERKRRIVAEKEAAFYRKQRATSERSRWVAEAKENYPLSAHALDDIKTSSRREFLRAAKLAHDTAHAYLKPALEQQKAQLLAEREGALAEERKKAELAWGKPTAGPGAQEKGADTDLHEQIVAARKSGDLAKVIMLQGLAQMDEAGE